VKTGNLLLLCAAYLLLCSNCNNHHLLFESDVSIAKVLLIFSFAPLSRIINLSIYFHRRFQRSFALEGIKTFYGAIVGETSFIGKTTCDYLLLNLFILIMGMSKDVAGKEIMPSTTRGGTDLPKLLNQCYLVMMLLLVELLWIWI
jgi:hypothetical protein